MRKRIVIAAIAVVVIGIGAGYFAGQPRKGSLEYHKKKYLEEQKRLSHPWVERFAVPSIVRKFYFERCDKRRKFHQRALINEGYLAERTVRNGGLFPPEMFTPLSVAVSNDAVTLAFVYIDVDRTKCDGHCTEERDRPS